jgi:hypothetical protein
MKFSSSSRRAQYAGFLAIILAIELVIAVSLYTYKDHLAVGLQDGLNNSIKNYGPVHVMKSADFDAMQENVNEKTFLIVARAGIASLAVINLHS